MNQINMDYKDINNKNEKDLHVMLVEKRNELRELKFKDSEKQLKNVRAIRTTKKIIAKILTAIKSKNKPNATKAIADKQENKT
jgi:ribosomal protein L29